MSEQILLKGNEAIAESAIRAGMNCYFGYPITPQSELITYMARNLRGRGGVFIQAESEISAISMVYGAASAGARAMTSSSSPGISLKQEGISYLAGARLPAVIVNISRGGPGLGNIAASQSDYFQSCKGGGHGGYHLVVYAPASVQEAADLTYKAFHVADLYRNPVLILADAIIGQMLEPVALPAGPPEIPAKPWAVGGSRSGRERNIVSSFSLEDGDVEAWNWQLRDKYRAIKERELMVDLQMCDDAEIALVAYGTSARIAQSVMRKARAKGCKVGLVRPVTLWPFPYDAIARVAKKARCLIVVEMSLGQMVEDVRLAAPENIPIHFHGRPGGGIPEAAAIMEIIDHVSEGGKGPVETRGTTLDWKVS